MTAHSDGLGKSWNEAVDVDQPHGLDYREWNDIRIGTRKRMEQEHASFADSTVGGIHKPGEVAVMYVSDGTTGDISTLTRGHGVLWDSSSRLWCNTALAGVSSESELALLSLHPDKQWDGGDVTWQGSHQFDASVDITVLNIDASLSVGGHSDFSDAIFDWSVDISGALDCSVLSVDSGACFGGDVSFDGNIKVDGTAVEIGEGEGLILFYDPTTPYAGGESVTFPNGLIMKHGEVTFTSPRDVSFGSGLESNPVSVNVTVRHDSAGGAAVAVKDVSKNGFTIYSTGDGSAFYWQVWGK